MCWALQVCDRALRTALAGLQASEADEACAVLAGDALDDMAVATNRCGLLPLGCSPVSLYACLSMLYRSGIYQSPALSLVGPCPLP